MKTVGSTIALIVNRYEDHNMKTIDLVLEFQRTFDPVQPICPLIPDLPTRMLRMQLITEELAETCYALCKGDLVKLLDGLCDLQYVVDGTVIKCGLYSEWYPVNYTYYGKWYKPNIPEETEALLTPFYYGLAMLVKSFRWKNAQMALNGLETMDWSLRELVDACGFNAIWEPAFREVHRSNMSKAGPDGKPVTDGAGRVQKGSNYSPANLAQFLGDDYRGADVA